MANMAKEKVIYTNWLAFALRNQGFKLLRTEINPNHPQYDCWVFENNDDLQIAIAYLTRQRKERK